MARAATPESEATVDASMDLGKDLGVNEVPTLFVNGRAIPANAPYDILKKIIDYQIKVETASRVDNEPALEFDCPRSRLRDLG